MQQVVESKCNLNFDEFNTILNSTKSVVAGSAALYAYLNKDIDKISDLDIWVSNNAQHLSLVFEYLVKNGYSIERTTQITLNEIQKSSQSTQNSKQDSQLKQSTTTSTSDNNYKQLKQSTTTSTSDNNYKQLKQQTQIRSVSMQIQSKSGDNFTITTQSGRSIFTINTVYTFSKPQCISVQLIHTNLNNAADCVKSFDLSFCATWWDGVNLQTLYPALTQQMEGFIMISASEMRQYEYGRLMKYLERGFTIVPKTTSLDLLQN